jgi:hypothetical protein
MDIRSAEFREMMRGYLNDHTRHFQHEFYNFVLSGMRLEEYDRSAVYSSPARARTMASGAAAAATESVPHSGEPPVVTISDDEGNDAFENTRKWPYLLPTDTLYGRN